MKFKIIVLTIAIAVACSNFVLASVESYAEHNEDVVNVGNKICPVSGESLEGMGGAQQIEYNGKVYNLCCQMCAKSFKKDPEKYSKIAEESLQEEAKVGHEHGGDHHQ